MSGDDGRPRVLVTNDDGIDAPGLHVLAATAVAAGFDVTIAAPAEQSSGSSASITATEVDGRIGVERRQLDGLDGVPAFAVQGGPGLIALIAAHGAFGQPPELVLSGVNHGANVGRAILHSGTVGAALTAGLNGARGIAISLDVGMRPSRFHWATGADAAVALIPDLRSRPPGTVLNVNAPNALETLGVIEAALAPFGIVQTTMHRDGDHHVRLAVEDVPNEPVPDSDAALLAEGWATLTAITAVTAVPLLSPVR